MAWQGRLCCSHLGVKRVASVNLFIAMAALAAAVKQKEDQAALERSLKQGTRVRLLADRGISAAALQSQLGEFLRFKNSKDLWCYIAPPPTGPQQYGWHTYPHPEWLAKTAPMLYDLVGLAPNTKLQSSKLVTSLKGLLDAKELDINVKQGRSVQDSLDQLDLTIRILLNMVRTLKCQELQRIKVQRSLSKQDWMKIELVLDRVKLPAEMMAAGSLGALGEEEVPLRTICATSNMDGQRDASPVASSSSVLSLVPYQPVKQQKQQGASLSQLRSLPAVFQKFEDKDKEVLASSACVPSMGGSINVDLVLASANAYEAKAASLPLPKPKKKVEVQKKKKNNHAKNKKKSKAKKVLQKKEALQVSKTIKKPAKKKQAAREETDQLSSTYKAGEMTKQRDLYIKEHMESGAWSRSEALKSWSTSLRRAMLLKDLTVAELVKRRFVASGTQSNPFAERVQMALNAPNVD